MKFDVGSTKDIVEAIEFCSYLLGKGPDIKVSRKEFAQLKAIVHAAGRDTKHDWFTEIASELVIIYPEKYITWKAIRVLRGEDNDRVTTLGDR